MRALEIAERDKVAFPRCDGTLLNYHQRQAIRRQGRLRRTNSGRWTAYTLDRRGGNVALRELAYPSAAGEVAKTKTGHARHFVFNLLRVFGPSMRSSERAATLNGRASVQGKHRPG